MSKWIGYNEKEDIIAVTSSVRMYRNIQNINFLPKLDSDNASEVIEKTKDAISTIDGISDYKFIRFNEDELVDVQRYYEKHLIGRNALSNPKNIAMFINNDEDISIAINELDHIRITGESEGFNLRSSYEKCNKTDSLIESNLDYVFSERYGYITTVVNDTGTGLKGMVIVHIPLIVRNNLLKNIKQMMRELSISVRPVYTIDNKCIGDYYIISSTITTGMTEEDILVDLEDQVFKIISIEYALLQKAKRENDKEILDKSCRAVALIKNSVIIPIEEGINLISNVRLGIEMAIINDIDIKVLDKLLIKIQPNNIKSRLEEDADENDINLERARLLREELNRT